MFLEKRKLLKIVLALLLLTTATYGVWAGSEYVAHRAELGKWTPEAAMVEANNDIARGSLKIYLHGSFAAYMVGVAEEQRSLVAHLPTAEAGVGCVFKYEDVFDAQREYAIRYNKTVVQYLQRQAKATPRQS